MAGLPVEVFTADDSLGWTYQFWRAIEKDAANSAGRLIDAANLPAVTQLFTEPYMVKFLLHNTVGAWWAGKVLTSNPELARSAADEQTLRDACALPNLRWEFLRFVRESADGLWRPAAGSFPHWPPTAAKITYCDPCCGSGHFLVEALYVLAALREHEEGMSGEEAARAVLRDNLYGLELDGRCVQIAAFNTALAAWRVAGGPIQLPQPHIAWVGAPSPMSRVEMAGLGKDDIKLSQTLERLHDKFVHAPLLGSLLEIEAHGLLDFHLHSETQAALAYTRDAEPQYAEGVIAARGLFDAASLLTKKYILLATNVPFLGRGKQCVELAEYIARRMPDAKADLATAMLKRAVSMCSEVGSVAVVSPQNWFFLASYKEFRRFIFDHTKLIFLAALGEEAWEAFGQRGPLATLSIFSAARTRTSDDCHAVLDATGIPDRAAKIEALANKCILFISQKAQRSNTNMTLSMSPSSGGKMLSEYASIYEGLSTGDNGRYKFFFWEVNESKAFVRMQGSPSGKEAYSGCHHVLRWEDGAGAMSRDAGARIQGQKGWGKSGFLISAMRTLAVSLKTEEIHEKTTAAIVPREPEFAQAIWHFLTSPAYSGALRETYKKVAVATGSMLSVPFDSKDWITSGSQDKNDVLPAP